MINDIANNILQKVKEFIQSGKKGKADTRNIFFFNLVFNFFHSKDFNFSFLA